MSSKVKKKILKLKESSTLVINEKSKDLISKGKKVYQFGPTKRMSKKVIELYDKLDQEYFTGEKNDR